MTPQELAKKLDGREIGEEITEAEATAAKKAGLVVVFGASDDMVEFRGAIYDEIGAYNGTHVQIDKAGLLPQRDQIDDDDELEKYFIRKRGNRKTIELLWCKEGEYSWTFKTDIPHATFEIFEDGEPYCRGIVFSMENGMNEQVTPHIVSISGRRIEALIRNAHRLLGKRYGQSPLWSIISDLTGHGSTMSSEMCKAVNLDPCQPCSTKILKPVTPRVL